jgi:hypothetical protein
MMRKMGLAAVRQTPCSTFAQLGAAVLGVDAAADDDSRSRESV